MNTELASIYTSVAAAATEVWLAGTAVRSGHHRGGDGRHCLYADFVGRFRDAAEKLRAGDREAVFPPGLPSLQRRTDPEFHFVQSLLPGRRRPRPRGFQGGFPPLEEELGA